MRFDAAHVAGTKCPISSSKKSLQATPASLSKAAARNLSLRSSTTIQNEHQIMLSIQSMTMCCTSYSSQVLYFSCWWAKQKPNKWTSRHFPVTCCQMRRNLKTAGNSTFVWENQRFNDGFQWENDSSIELFIWMCTCQRFIKIDACQLWEWFPGCLASLVSWIVPFCLFQGDEVEAMISHRSALVPLSFRSVLHSEVGRPRKGGLGRLGTTWYDFHHCITKNKFANQ